MEENQVHIPDGWKLNDLGNLIKEQKKSSLKVSDAANFGKFPFFTSGEAVLKHTSKQLDGKNIFLATGGVANIKYYEGDAAYSTDTYAVTTKDEIDTEYLYFDLLNILYYINANYFQGSGLKHLQKKDLKKHQILFPKNPIEQTTIARILSKVDEAIAQTEQLIAKYTRIKTGLMQDLLTKGIDEHGNIRSEQTHEFKDSPLGRIPKEWECILLDEIISSFDSGWSPNCEARQATIGEWGSLKTTSITWDGYNSNENKKLPDNLIPRKRLEVVFDDILITRVGPRERVGVVVHVNDYRSKLMLSDNMLRVNLNKSRGLFYPFVPLMVGSEVIQREFKNKIAGLAEAQVVINQQSIKSTYILIPDKEEQTTIFNKSQLIKKTIDVEHLKLTKLQSLKTGLMQDLLSGKVRVNHLIKETASV